MACRVTLVSTSPRVAPGVLTAAAWDLLRSAAVCTASPAHPQLPALAEAGVAVEVLADPPAGGAALAALLRRRAAERGLAAAAWLLDPVSPTAADQALTAAEPGDEHIDRLVAIRELPGSALLDAVAVMDRLRSPGGCPWDAEQTHTSLAPYLLEEAYEAYQAIEDGDLAELREELGDVLLQVLFHARVAAEDETGGWDVDDVAAGLTAKLVRRHPHVFGDVTVGGADDVVTNWDAIKAQESREKKRESVTEGVPLALPALSLAAKLQKRAAGVGLPLDLVLPAAGRPGRAAADVVAELARGLGAADAADAGDGADKAAEAAEARVGDLLFAAVALARAAGVDPEVALRRAARAFRDRLIAAERAAAEGGGDPRDLDPAAWRAFWPS